MGTLRRPVHPVSFLVPHLEVEGSIEGVPHPSVEDQFMHHYLLLRVVRHIVGLRGETTMVVHQDQHVSPRVRGVVMVVEILII